jgi:uncharacterized oxidoreductase
LPSCIICVCKETIVRLKGNTILITGGTSGIGLALAEAFHREGNQVIVAGRRKDLLDQVVAANLGMKSAILDVADAEAIAAFGKRAKADHPALNVVINNAGIMRPESLRSGALANAEATVATNLLGTIRMTAALLPMLLEQSHAAIMTVTSGLAFVPLAVTPSYCATKAAIHSYTQSLRYQLRDSNVQVLELVPPYVQTELMGAGQARDPNAMPLKDYISESMRILKTFPDATEICVERVKPLRYAEKNGNYDEFYKTFNDRASSTHETL